MVVADAGGADPWAAPVDKSHLCRRAQRDQPGTTGGKRRAGHRVAGHRDGRGGVRGSTSADTKVSHQRRMRGHAGHVAGRPRGVGGLCLVGDSRRGVRRDDEPPRIPIRSPVPGHARRLPPAARPVHPTATRETLAWNSASCFWSSRSAESCFRDFSSKWMPLACALRFPGGTAMLLVLAGAFAGGIMDGPSW